MLCVITSYSIHYTKLYDHGAVESFDEVILACHSDQALALLAGVIKAPSHYAPHLDLNKSIERRNLVLANMKKQGMISEDQEKQAKSEEVTLAQKIDVAYGYFTDMVLAEAESMLMLDSEELLSSGYHIYTTLDQSLQSEVENVFIRNNFV